MDLDEVAEWIRVINVVTGIVALTWLITRVARYWSTYDRANRILMAVIMAYVLSSVYASAEAIYSHLTFGLRTFLYEAADLLLLWGMWQTRSNRYEYQRRRRDRD